MIATMARGAQPAMNRCATSPTRGVATIAVLAAGATTAAVATGRAAQPFGIPTVLH